MPLLSKSSSDSEILWFNSHQGELILFCSASLPLAVTRWVQLIFSSCSMQCGQYILATLRENAENWTRGRWVQSENAIHCAMRAPLRPTNSLAVSTYHKALSYFSSVLGFSGLANPDPIGLTSRLLSYQLVTLPGFDLSKVGTKAESLSHISHCPLL